MDISLRLGVGSLVTMGEGQAPAWPAWSAALAAVMAGTGSARILVRGNSNTTASESEAGTSVDARKNSWPVKLAELLVANGIPAAADTFFGPPGYATIADINAYDPRLNIASSWEIEARTALGPRCLRQRTDTGAFVFTPTGEFDAVDIYTLPLSGTPSIAVTIDGAAMGNIAIAAGTTIQKTTFSGFTKKVQAISFARNSGDCRVVGIHCYQTGVARVEILHNGYAGATFGSFSDTANAYSTGNCISVLDPDLLITDLGTNDWNASTNTTTFGNQVQTHITGGKVTGDVLIVGPIPSDPATRASIAAQAIYRDILAQKAAANACRFLDFTARWVSWAAGNALGYYASDIHATTLGQADKAQAVYDKIRAA